MTGALRAVGDPDGEGPGRVPPHDLDAERALLGACLLSRDACAAAAEVIPNAGVFYRPSHQHLYAAIARLHATEVGVDNITVAAELDRTGHLDTVGGMAALMEFTMDAPGTANAGHYARIVLDKADARALIVAASAAQAEAYAGRSDEARARLRETRLEGLSVGLTFEDLRPILAGDHTPPEPQILERTDRGALLYAGTVQMLYGEPSAGKSWIAAAAIGQVLTAGGSALVIDHEDTPTTWVHRLRALGIVDDDLRRGLHYLRPSAAAHAPQIIAAVDRLNVDLVVIDSVGRALAADGLSEQDADDFNTWFEDLPAPLARTGACVVLLDHVVKSKDDRGRWPRGTGAKLAALDGAAYEVKKAKPFDRHHAGRISLILWKDRHGAVGVPEGTQAASVYLDPLREPGRLHVTIDPPLPDVRPTDEAVAAGKAHAEEERRGVLKERIEAVLEAEDDWLGKSAILEGVRATKPRIRAGDSFARSVIVELKLEGRILAQKIGSHEKYRRLPRQAALATGEESAP